MIKLPEEETEEWREWRGKEKGRSRKGGEIEGVCRESGKKGRGVEREVARKDAGGKEGKIGERQ